MYDQYTLTLISNKLVMRRSTPNSRQKCTRANRRLTVDTSFSFDKPHSTPTKKKKATHKCVTHIHIYKSRLNEQTKKHRRIHTLKVISALTYIQHTPSSKFRFLIVVISFSFSSTRYHCYYNDAIHTHYMLQ